MARGASWSLIINFSGVAIAFLVQLLLARMLGADQYGLYIYALAWMSVARLIGLFELNNAAVRFVGEYYGRRDWPLLKGYLRLGHGVVAASSGSIAIFAALAVWVLRDFLPAPLASSFWAACALLLPSTLLALKSRVIQGYKGTARSQLPELVVRPALFVVGIAAVGYAFGYALTAWGAILLNALATCVALLLSWTFQKNIEPKDLALSAATYKARLWLSTASGLMWISAANLILSQQVDVLVVGTYMGTTEAGIYGLASQISSLLRIAGTSIVYVTLPFVADLYAKGDKEKLQKVVRWTVGVGTILGVTGFLGVVVLGKYVLAWFGPGFVQGYVVLIILSTVWVIDASFGNLGGFLLTLTGHHNRAGVITVLTALGNIAMMFILIPRYGAVGAAAATLLANAVKLVAFAVAARTKIGVDVLSLFKPGSK